MSKIAENKALEAYPIESHEIYDCDGMLLSKAKLCKTSWRRLINGL